MSKRKDVIRAGDMVRIITPEIFVRCGYENTLSTTRKEVEEKYSPDVLAFMEKIGYNHSFLSTNRFDKKLFREIINSIAYAENGKKMRSGNERKIYTENIPTMKGKVMKVHETFVCKTGKYFPPSGGYDSYTGDYDYEDGGLDKQGTHVILCVYEPNNVIWCKGHGTHTIEKCHVEKIQ